MEDAIKSASANGVGGGSRGDGICVGVDAAAGCDAGRRLSAGRRKMGED